MAVTINENSIARRGGTNNYGVTGLLALDTSYPTGGYTLRATDFALSQFQSFTVENSAGYIMETNLSTDRATAQLLVYASGGAGTTGATSAGTPAGTNGTSAVTGTGTFLGTTPVASLDINTPVFSGTGQSSAGQVITTTDNQTMTLNQCAGMWFVSATHGPYLIASNTAVSGAPAVLTIYGTAPTTDAGTYKILKGFTPVGSVTALSATAAAQTFTGSALATHTHSFTSGAGAQVSNGTNLSALTNIQFTIEGL